MVREIEHEKWIEWPHARLRAERVIDSGTVVRFVVQLEYDLDDEWQPMVRFDHDTRSEGGHDVTQEGLHMDVYRAGEKYRVETGFPSVPLPEAPRYCERYINERAEDLLRRFEQWHDIRPK